MLTLAETFQLSKNHWVPDPKKLGVLDLAQVSGKNERKIATGELLVGRTPAVQVGYAHFLDGLAEFNTTVQEHLRGRFARLGQHIGSLALPRAVLQADEYPANMQSSEGPVNHYNLWIALAGQTEIPDFLAGELALGALINRNHEREAKCYQPTQSVPPTSNFLYGHFHVFTQSPLPNLSPVVIA